MSVRYWKPLEDALQRTRALLFAPFDAVRWFVLGFTAWLIHLGSMGGSAAGNDPDLQAHVRTGDWEGAFDALGEAFGELLPSGLAAMLILGLVALALLISLALLWVGSRARFVWLENLTRGDHRLGQHWSSQGHLGDSFFLWKVVFYAALLIVITPIVLFGGLIGALTGEGIGGPATLMGWVGLGIAVVLVAVVAGYVDFFAESFVTRIMHRRNVGVMAGWREFGRLFGERPGHFVLVGIAKLVLRLAGGALVVAVGLATCCVGFLLLSLPYIGAVLQLPIYVALRYYDLSWLGQLDPDLGPPDPPRLAAGESTPDSDPSP